MFFLMFIYPLCGSKFTQYETKTFFILYNDWTNFHFLRQQPHAQRNKNT